MAVHHLPDEYLLAYAAGSLEEPLALLVATHLALCPRCRSENAQLEAIGGQMLEQLQPADLDDQALERLLARFDEPDPEPDPRPVADSHHIDPSIPQPLRDYLGASLEDLDWVSFRGLKAAGLLAERTDFKTRMLWINAGTAMPVHGHQANEMTLVLQGDFEDDGVRYGPGDVAIAGPETHHRPIAGSEQDCLCLVVTDGPLRLTGPLGRWLNPFLRL